MDENELLNTRHDEYLKRRDEFLKIRESSQDSFDKTVLYLATGGLVLSITFMSQIGRPFDPVTRILIALVWLSLVLTIMLNVTSYLFAKWNMEDKIKQIDSNYDKWLGSDHKGQIESEKDSIWKNRTEKCNVFSISSFVFSVILFFVFVVLVQYNDYAKNCDAEKEVKQTMSEQKSTKSYGLTEAASAIKKVVASSTSEKGLTEATPAISKPVPDNKDGNKKEQNHAKIQPKQR